LLLNAQKYTRDRNDCFSLIAVSALEFLIPISPISAHLSDDEPVSWRPYCCDFCTWFQSDSLDGNIVGRFFGNLVFGGWVDSKVTTMYKVFSVRVLCAGRGKAQKRGTRFLSI
jgi:hypothetical protein